MTQPTDTFTFLSLCARARGHPAQYARLAAAPRPADWDATLTLAEQHGLSPLLHAHLHAAGIEIEPQARQRLQARALQHAHANRVRAQVLAEVLGGLRSAGIPALLLKGGALAHLVYPQPGLRAMRDIDLLVPDAERAQAVLLELGFAAPHYTLAPDHPHLPAVKTWIDGQQVTIEVHRQLMAPEAGLGATTYDDLAPAAQRFDLCGVPAYTLGKKDMLWHVYAHAFLAPLTYEPYRLIWIADLVSLVEAWIDAIDWDAVRRRYRRVYHALPALHPLTPWSEAVVERLAMDVRHVPAGVGQTFAGWPRFSLSAQWDKGVWGTVRDTFWPPAWWLCVRYGAAGWGKRLWARCVRHPLYIVGQVPGYLRAHAAYYARRISDR